MLANLNSAHNTGNFIIAVVIDYSIIYRSNFFLLYTRKMERSGFSMAEFCMLNTGY